MTIVIVGGGLAGGSAAARLAMLGRRAVVLEREASPHHKVCGEFLSVEAGAALARLGLDVGRLGSVPITHLDLWAGRRHVAAPLGFAATSVTRQVLDAALLDHAMALGVEVQRGVDVRHLTEAGAMTDGGEVAGDALLLASGKHDLRGAGRDAADNGLIGFKMLFRHPALARAMAGRVAVVLFDGGYAGLQPVEGGRLNLCLLVDSTRYRAAGDWPGLLAELVREPGLAALADASPEWPRPLAIARVPYGWLAPDDGRWRLGDQAAVIPSFCGDGMAIAVHSGVLAADMVAAGAGAEAYRRRLRRDTARPVRLAMGLQSAARHPLARLAVLSGLAVLPGAIATLARLTRVARPDALAA